MKDIQQEWMDQLAYAKDRLTLMEELILGLDLNEIHQVLTLSNLMDESMMLLGNIGIGIRESYRREQEKHRLQEEETAMNQQMMEELASLLKA